MEDIFKPLAGAALAVALLILFVYVAIYIAIPVAVIALGYAAYAYWRDHPDTQANRLRSKAEKLHRSIAQSTFDFSSFGVFEPLARQLCEKTIPPVPPDGVGPIELGRYVDRLSKIAAQPNSLDLAAGAIRECLANLSSLIPEHEKGMFSVPLMDMLDAGHAVQSVAAPFFSEDLIQSGALSDLRETLNKNLHRMSALPYTIDNFDSPKLIMPSQFKGTPRQVVYGYLRDTPLIDLFESPLSIGIPEKLRYQGTWIIAPSGAGKTTLLSALLKEDLERVRDGTASVIVMDSKGDFLDAVRQLKQFAPGEDLDGKLVLIEPSGNLALNPLDIGASVGHTVDLIEYILAGFLDAATTPKQAAILRRTIIAMEKIPNASFRTFFDFLDDWEPFEEYVNLLHPDDRDYFLKGKYDESETKRTRNEIYWRIDGMITKVPILRDMFKAPKTYIDIGKEMDAGKVIVIDNSQKAIGAGQEFFGRLFLALITAAAQQGRSDKLPCFVYLDEADTVIARDPATVTILDKCRSQKIGLTVAHQRLNNLKLEDVKDALMNCGVKIARPDDDADSLASRLRTSAETLRSLPKHHFALFMRDLTREPLTVSVPNDPVSSWPRMTANEMRKIREEMREAYCYWPVPESPKPSPEPSPAPPVTPSSVENDDTAPKKRT